MENEIRSLPSSQGRVERTAVTGPRERSEQRQQNERHRRALREARQRSRDKLEVSDESRRAAAEEEHAADREAPDSATEEKNENEAGERGRRVDIRI